MDIYEFEPMLAVKLDLDRVDRYHDYTMEVKLDGVRCLAIKEPNGRLTMWTRQGNEISNKLPYLRNQLRSIAGAYVLDGELGYLQFSDDFVDPTIPYAIDFNKTMRVIGSGTDVAIEKQRLDHPTRRICFTVFDILQVGNWPSWRDPQRKRRRGLVDVITNLSQDAMPDLRLSYSWDKFDPEVHSKVLELGGEGTMLKNPDAQYHLGKRRTNTWFKLKGFDTVDCKITGWEHGKGKYEGAIGALIVRDPQGREIRVSGMSDQERFDMTQHFDDQFWNKMCEVKYFGKVGIEKDGYRHPQFLRMRPDLDAS